MLKRSALTVSAVAVIKAPPLSQLEGAIPATQACLSTPTPLPCTQVPTQLCPTGFLILPLSYCPPPRELPPAAPLPSEFRGGSSQPLAPLTCVPPVSRHQSPSQLALANSVCKNSLRGDHIKNHSPVPECPEGLTRQG